MQLGLPNRRGSSLRHEFVEFIPDELDELTVYISIEYATASHKCVCGCGNRVVTPISPTDWQLTFDGKTISLYPSIGNWSFPCKSHYWVEKNTVYWAEQWSDARIQACRAHSAIIKKSYQATGQLPVTQTPISSMEVSEPAEDKQSFWQIIKSKFRS
jgi:hypothetical protein